MIVEGNKIIAESGNLLRRIADRLVVGTEYCLGYTYFIGGAPIPDGKFEVPEDYEEVSVDLIYSQRVADLIRIKYSLDDELAIQRQRDTKPEDFAEYNTFCEECKSKAKKELNL